MAGIAEIYARRDVDDPIRGLNPAPLQQVKISQEIVYPWFQWVDAERDIELLANTFDDLEIFESVRISKRNHVCSEDFLKIIRATHYLVYQVHPVRVGLDRHGFGCEPEFRFRVQPNIESAQRSLTAAEQIRELHPRS